MSNPDEDTAISQFGSDGKYFGIKHTKDNLSLVEYFNTLDIPTIHLY